MRARGPALLACLGLLTAALSVPAGAQDGPRSVTAQVRVGTAPSSLRVELSLSRPLVKAGERVRARALAHNDGVEPLHDGALTLFVSEAHLRVNGASTIEVGAIKGRRKASAEWELCSTQPGVYLIQARGRAMLQSTSLETFSPAVELVVDVAPGKKPATCPSW